MNKKDQLIQLYCDICQYYNSTLIIYAQRQSNNYCPKFTDEECITIYIHGILEQKFTVKAIYDFIREYYEGWFPNMPSYKAFNKRICYLSEAITMLANCVIKELGSKAAEEIRTHIIDSMPVVVANSKRSSGAKVAPEMCDKGYCDSKKMFYYGVKIHALGESRYETIPTPKLVSVTKASEHDLKEGKALIEDVYGIDLIADKAYIDEAWEKEMKEKNNITVLTPVKLKKGQAYLESADKYKSSGVSRVRQPIESFFNWLQEKTQIQRASKVRSEEGLTSFIYARIASVCFIKLYAI
jgi:hypothetical protein